MIITISPSSPSTDRSVWRKLNTTTGSCHHAAIIKRGCRKPWGPLWWAVAWNILWWLTATHNGDAVVLWGDWQLTALTHCSTQRDCLSNFHLIKCLKIIFCQNYFFSAFHNFVFYSINLKNIKCYLKTYSTSQLLEWMTCNCASFAKQKKKWKFNLFLHKMLDT